jgi:hypothetical protein
MFLEKDYNEKQEIFDKCKIREVFYTMKTLKHKLLSKPGKTLSLPEGTLAHVRHFFWLSEFAHNKRNILMNLLDNDPYFKEMDSSQRENLLHMNYKFNKYRQAKDKDTIYALIGKFEISNCYGQLESIEGDVNKYLNSLEEKSKK